MLPVTDRAADYAAEVSAKLGSMGFRVEVDGRSEKIGKKIREATLEKIPYMLVVGDRDMENGTVSPRHRTGEDLGGHVSGGLCRGAERRSGHHGDQVISLQPAPAPRPTWDGALFRLQMAGSVHNQQEKRLF